MADNKKIAEQVLAAVGGAANLKDATHCMTRLRLYLKDDSIPKDDEVKKISGVLGVVRGGQQYQIVIGTNVPKVYEELCKLAGISASAAVKDDAAAAQDAAITKRKLTPKQAGKNIMGYLAGCMTPMIPVLLAGGFLSLAPTCWDCTPWKAICISCLISCTMQLSTLCPFWWATMPPNSWVSTVCWVLSSAAF